jgi:hypothetical protein
LGRHEAIIILLRVTLSEQCLVPLPFQFPSHQTILWFHGMILASGSLGLVTSPFPALMPVLSLASPLSLHNIPRRQAQFQEGRLEQAQHQAIKFRFRTFWRRFASGTGGIFSPVGRA